MYDHPFHFFKLPAELRNKIYRLVVITGKTLIIQDMHPEELEKGQVNGAYQSRSTYLATDHVCSLETWLTYRQYPNVEPCMIKETRFGPRSTTYMLATPHSIDATTITMLSLNKQSREEVASIFYGENTFHFTTMSSLVPFMKDRTVETRKYIERLWLTLTVDDDCWDVIFTEYGRPATWNAAFSSFAKLPHVHIKQLCIHVDDRKASLLTCGLNFGSRSMLWLHKLGKLQNLEMLGLRHDRRAFRRRGPRGDSWIADTAESETERELWRFLAPKMLKKEAGDHSPEALQQRRIVDFSHTPAHCSEPRL